MNFSEFAQFLSKLEKISSRIEITKVLSELFGKLEEKETAQAVYLLLGGLAPKYKIIVFNVADKMMIRAVSQAYKKSSEEVIDIYRKSGDLGDVVEHLSKSKKSKGNNISIIQVHKSLADIAQDSGEKSQERKVEKSVKLLNSLDPVSAKFVVRIMLGKLRLGFSDSTMLDAISWMIAGDKTHKKQLEKTYFVLPDVGILLSEVKKNGIEKATKDIKPIVGVPVLPLLAARIKTPEEMLEKMGGVVAVEPKLDGLRLSLHIDKAKGIVKAFTRNLNENSWMFPELGELGKYINAESVILDTEAVGLTEETKKMANFQATMTRRRKHNIGNVSKKTKITFFVFDILSINGKSLMNEPFSKRRSILEKTIVKSPLIKTVEYSETKDPKAILKLHKKYSSEGYEGIMVKKLDSSYVPGRTGWRWVKMKQTSTHIAKVADTVDCLVMGYSVGKGKRAEFGMGRFLVGISDGDKIKTTTKIGTGLTDAQFREMKKRLTKLEVKTKPKQYELHK
ncbi:ATP-dependent DNA ligase, partial [Candidatus Microgenomates bacterium]|nr:ATP-dependent DNA ligase [Candidatus Microgenomates bacterium]